MVYQICLFFLYNAIQTLKISRNILIHFKDKKKNTSWIVRFIDFGNTKNCKILLDDILIAEKMN